MTDEKSERSSIDDTGIQSVDVSQRAVFLAALIPGAFAIGISRFLGLSGTVFWIVSVAFPVACMLSYWLVNVRGEFFDSTRAQVADNIYFLGFLYFLVSLSATLILFSSTENLEQRVVVEGFGIALVTTILGLFLRILVLQQSAPIEESRERAERDLLQEILQSRANITAGNEALRQAQDIAISGLAETSRLLAEKTAATGEEVNRKVATAIVSIEAKLNQIDIPADLITRAFQPLLQDLRNVVNEFGQSTQEQAKANSEFASKVRALASPMQGTAKAFEAFNRSVESARPGIESIEQSINTSAAGTAAVAKSTEATRTSMEALAGSVAGLHEMVRTLQLDTGLKQTVAQLHLMQEQLAILQRLATDMVPAVKQGLGNLPALLDKLNGVAEEYRRAASTTQTLVTEVGRMQGPEALQRALQEVAGVVSTLRVLQEAMNTQIERLRQTPPPPRSAYVPMPPAVQSEPQAFQPRVASGQGEAQKPGIFGRWFGGK